MLSQLEQLVLLAVLRLGDDAYGANIREDLAVEAGHDVTVPTLYVALSRLEKRGLVRSWMADPTPVRGGKSKRYYALEPAGATELRYSRDLMERMWLGIDASLLPEES